MIGRHPQGQKGQIGQKMPPRNDRLQLPTRLAMPLERVLVKIKGTMDQPGRQP
jgi:hypothetical protein